MSPPPDHPSPTKKDETHGHRAWARSGGPLAIALVLLGAAFLVGMPGVAASHQADGRAVIESTLEAPPPILSFTAVPNPSEVGVQSRLTVSLLGNLTTGLSFVYSGLPAGCSSANLSVLTCTPSVAGNFSVKVSISNLAGVAESTLNWTIQAALKVAITATTAVSSSPLTIHFQGTVSGGTNLTDVAWTYGDGTNASGSLDVNHTYSGAGTYAITLKVIDSLAVVGLGYDNVTLSAPTGTLVALAVDATTTGSVPLTVSFQGSATGGVSPYSYSWAFGDGASGSGTSPTHTYTAQGDFEAVLTVTDAADVSAQASVVVVVEPPAATLAASIQASVTAGTAPLEVNFQGSARGGASPYTYAWTFADGSARVTGNTVVHTFTTAGSFEVTLTVTDANGTTATAQVGILAKSSTGALIASASAVISAGTAPFLASFSASASGGTAPYSFTWNFGDGSEAASGSLVAHLYVNPGTFLATVTVKDALGNVTTAHAEVSVTSAVAGSLAVQASSTIGSGVAPLAVGFMSAVSGGTAPYVYLWSFGDGSTSTLASPSFNFTSPGSYTITLVVTDSLGATALSYVSIQVLGGTSGLSLAAAYNVTSVTNASETVSFQSAVSGGSGSLGYQWSFGEGSANASTAATMHVFNSSGDFAVTLTVNDSAGASATYVLNLVVSLSGLLVLGSTSQVQGTSALSWDFQAAAAGGTGPYAYHWAFGDGAFSSSGAEATHTYSHSGTYLVEVTATDAQGQSSTHDMQVLVPATSPKGTSMSIYPDLAIAGVALAVGVVVALLVVRRSEASMLTSPAKGVAESHEKSYTEASADEKDALSDMF